MKVDLILPTIVFECTDYHDKSFIRDTLDSLGLKKAKIFEVTHVVNDDDNWYGYCFMIYLGKKPTKKEVDKLITEQLVKYK